MSHISWIGGLRKELHHVAKATNADWTQEHEPAMVIFCRTAPGRSFIIPLSAMWKYLDPCDNNDEKTRAADKAEWDLIVERAVWAERMAVSHGDKMRAAAKKLCLTRAIEFSQHLGFMLCLSWNLAHLIQMFGLDPNREVAAQLLIWIQNNLDDLKNMPDAPEGKKVVAGEMSILCDGQKLATKDVVVGEEDFLGGRVAGNA